MMKNSSFFFGEHDLVTHKRAKK